MAIFSMLPDTRSAAEPSGVGVGVGEKLKADKGGERGREGPRRVSDTVPSVTALTISTKGEQGGRVWTPRSVREDQRGLTDEKLHSLDVGAVLSLRSLVPWRITNSRRRLAEPRR